MNYGLESKVAIVTGGGSGIGEATVHRLISAGSKVCIVDVDEDAVARMVAQYGKAQVRGVVADVSRPSDIERYAEDCLIAFGRIDCLHSNAGIIGALGPIHEASAENFDHLFSVNVRSAILAIKAVVPSMKQQGGGAIVITASVSGVRPSPGMGLYAASKLALVALAKTAAVELGPFNIRVNAIAPGLTDTPAYRALQDPTAEGAGGQRFDGLMLPLARIGTASEVANLVAWLMSTESSYVTGALYHVDGGLGI